MKGPAIFTILMLIGLILMAFGITFMPDSHVRIKFEWYYAIAITGLLIEIIAFVYLNWLRKLPG